jgi:hypothetical protein
MFIARSFRPFLVCALGLLETVGFSTALAGGARRFKRTLTPSRGLGGVFLADVLKTVKSPPTRRIEIPLGLSKSQ